jgi:broad specificity phosphatase PhoE
LPHRFWLVRHALVHPASLTSLYGTNDVPICESTMQADAPRYAALAARLPRPARLVCTPLSRTQLTAAAIQRAGYPAQTPLLDAAFVEQDFGALQGLPIRQFEARPVAGMNGAPHAENARHPFWPIHALETPPGGESFDTMIARVGAGLERLAANATADGNTIIISHGGAIRAACAHALGLTAHQALCLAVDNISLTRLEHNGHGWRVLSINEHLSTLASDTTESPSIAPTQKNLKQTQGAHP